ncbi:hypothetical protein [Tomitella cavernea]|uniref:Uncharacterized protein n=1 Tax=Tomitella cavernea TaxID=1387982 RepID=A0ABP9D4D5_9ACTN|nr:hypothetical protein [Tomitella cavernea]
MTITAPTPPTDDDITRIVSDYVAERASIGVKFAQAHATVTTTEGEVTVVFDPALAGMTDELFAELRPFDNLAACAGNPLAGNDDVGAWRRTRLIRVDTLLRGGNDLGSLTVHELHQRATVVPKP